MKRKRAVNKTPPRPEVPHNKVAGGDFLDKLHAYRDLHAHAFFSSLGRLLVKPFTTALTIGVLAISIALAACFYLLVANLEQLTGTIETSNQISLFLKDTVSEAEARKLVQTISKNVEVAEIKLISKDEALAEFKANSGLDTALDALEGNPLPIVLEVLPVPAQTNTAALQKLQQTLQQYPEVDEAQLDMQWLERMQSIIKLAEQATQSISILLGFGVLFITGNTIRLELHNRREEVVIAKLVGATNRFIQRPFLYGGFWIGFLSGVAAWFIVTVIMLLLWRSVENLSLLYEGSFHLRFLEYGESVYLILLSSSLGVIGSWAVLAYQLRQLRPE
ncbi:permease-like cell division protein FtsX [Methylomicrobium lacus]|uniref:permease-like cell division protein FtsX n=1 Tax=Methylomicrobium lacus TaxID=136992 RepID=UPI000A0738A4|nr:permease-like cell division protein FtsX [Methylomicrobium lacus]